MHLFFSRCASELQALGVPFGYSRLGVHSGGPIVGNFGIKAIFYYRAFGGAAERYPSDPLVRLHHQRLCQGKRGDRLVLESK